MRFHPSTHPDTYFDGEPDPAKPGGEYIVTSGVLAGVKIEPENVQTVYDEAIRFNRSVGAAVRQLNKSVDQALLKPALDSDGDPVLDENGYPTYVLKDKHNPVVCADYRVNFIGLSIPNIDAANKLLTLVAKPSLDEAAVHAVAHNSIAVVVPGVIVASLLEVRSFYKEALDKVGLAPLWK